MYKKKGCFCKLQARIWFKTFLMTKIDRIPSWILYFLKCKRNVTPVLIWMIIESNRTSLFKQKLLSCFYEQWTPKVVGPFCLQFFQIDYDIFNTLFLSLSCVVIENSQVLKKMKTKRLACT